MSVFDSALVRIAPSLRGKVRAIAHRLEATAVAATRATADGFERSVAAAGRPSPGATAIARSLKQRLESNPLLRLSNFFGQAFGKTRDWAELAVRDVQPASEGRVEFLATGLLRTKHPDQHYLKENVFVGTFDPARGTFPSLQQHPVPTWLEVKNLDNETLRRILRERWD
jgi:hypothetical protein